MINRYLSKFNNYLMNWESRQLFTQFSIYSNLPLYKWQMHPLISKGTIYNIYEKCNPEDKSRSPAYDALRTLIIQSDSLVQRQFIKKASLIVFTAADLLGVIVVRLALSPEYTTRGVAFGGFTLQCQFITNVWSVNHGIFSVEWILHCAKIALCIIIGG